jgi:hypothetical protein
MGLLNLQSLARSMGVAMTTTSAGTLLIVWHRSFTCHCGSTLVEKKSEQCCDMYRCQAVQQGIMSTTAAVALRQSSWIARLSACGT